ncbi:putative oxidoreductase (plasmid) [Sinorhizobium fredii NGR234]|uniref:3-oxoacyl-[acyl-carrier protein] reductase n=1 Tax=Sinorhizobium fredii (strain NBRC 101917 / NGR234) TaxID=394 RepID=Q6W1M2_SINFN|nr:SDR family oxidoreductase [Sinorhizobium fredii]AAQ87346.1 3-oxoacyl-[acyl-carrier protein] reductase [Sinorhizobium fredii NGR234]ACP21884.1 putative oxidoreductase [Sinorhizobium fredii NGR234]
MSKREVVIVTGASSGIGRATAVHLAEFGYDVGLTFGSNEAAGEETARRVRAAGGRAEVRQMSLGDPASIERALGGLIEAFRGVAAFVNNAGTLALASFTDISLADWRGVIDVNLTGSFLAGQLIARHMIETKTPGRIVNVSSVHEAVPLLGGAAYCTSKAGIGMLTKCMALDLAPHGIRVNAVGPGETATPMIGVAEGEDIMGRRRPETPLGRPGTPGEMAGAIAYLLAPEARFTTGTTLFVDGGLTLMAAIGNQRTIMESMRQGEVTNGNS